MKVLVAYDGSASADRIFNDLKRAGMPRDTKALVVSVGDILMNNPPIREVAAQVFTSRRVAAGLKTARSHGERVVREAEDLASFAADRLRTLFPEWKVRSRALIGSPALEIIEAANDFRADLIVVGSQGRTAIGRLLLGSVSKKISEEADCSVRVARFDAEQDEDMPPRIIIGVNDSPTAVQAILAVGKRVWQDGTEARLVAVRESDSIDFAVDSSQPAEGETDNEFQQQVTTRIREILDWGSEELKLIGINTSISIENGDAARILINEAKEWNADSIFVGTRGMDNFLEKYRLGSVSTAVVTGAGCSVEVVRPPESR